VAPTAVAPTARAHPLTSPKHWDAYWDHGPALPVEADTGEQSSSAAILDVIDRFLAFGRALSVLEVGGAPGGYAAHLHRRFGHEVSVLDNSPVGIEMTRRNFELLGIPGRVVQRDLFDTDAPPQFDVVYSLGLIEHFADSQAVLAAHLAYLRPGGRLIVGCPNLLGLNGVLLRRLSPGVLDWHHLEVMDLRTWPRFEHALDVRVLFRGYVAGFQPGMFWRRERERLLDKALARALAVLAGRWRGPVARAFGRLNSRHWSYYAIGVYEKPNCDD
jgi:SAM-dependent methyltransferase